MLQNASNVSGTVPGYADPTVAVVNRTEAGITVEVTMTYSYEYSCGSKAGHADNLRTRTKYLVTESETHVKTIHRDVNLLCD
ncbi:hypothetical protein [Haladaptatus sp. CMSO5]|uniref:hypothetical protein n=1 Tax=Haladaptatus sp. CMSO5 TaxID=3120514 RepID=UPI002FCDF1D3